MKVTIAGREVDLLTRGDLNTSLYGDPNDPNVDPQPIGKLLKSLADFAKRQPPTDQDVQVAATAAADNSLGGLVHATLDFGAPPPGFTWDLRRVVLTGQDPTTVTACTVRMYKSTVDPTKLVDIGTQLPTVAVYSRHEMNYKPDENVLVRVTGLAATTRVFGFLAAEQTRWQVKEAYVL